MSSEELFVIEIVFYRWLIFSLTLDQVSYHFVVFDAKMSQNVSCIV